MKLLYPDLYLESIYELDFDKLAQRGIRGLIADLDNTLVAWKNQDIPEKLVIWIKKAERNNIRVCIVSNNNNKRVQGFADRIKLPAISNANKPGKKGFNIALKALDLPPEEVAVIGDQIFTDVLGANRLGMFSILVIPIDRREFFGTKLLRLLERLILRFIARKDLSS